MDRAIKILKRDIEIRESKITNPEFFLRQKELILEVTSLKKALNTLNKVVKCYSEKDMDNAYDKGFKDGGNKDLSGSLIEFL